MTNTSCRPWEVVARPRSVQASAMDPEAFPLPFKAKRRRPEATRRDPEDSNKVRVGMGANWAYFLRAIRAPLDGWKYPLHEARPAGAASIDQDRPGQRPLGPVAATKSDPPRAVSPSRE